MCKKTFKTLNSSENCIRKRSPKNHQVTAICEVLEPGAAQASMTCAPLSQNEISVTFS